MGYIKWFLIWLFTYVVHDFSLYMWDMSRHPIFGCCLMFLKLSCWICPLVHSSLISQVPLLSYNQIFGYFLYGFNMKYVVIWGASSTYIASSLDKFSESNGTHIKQISWWMNLKETNRIWLPKWKAVTLVDGSKGKYIFLASNNDRVYVHGSKDHQKRRGAPCDIKTVTRGHRI